MLPSSASSTLASLPPTCDQWSPTQVTFCTGSSSFDDTSTGRRLTRNPASATRAALLAERTAANVATASTSVPMAVANVATVVQSIVSNTSAPLQRQDRHARPQTSHEASLPPRQGFPTTF